MKTILICEDDESIREVVSLVLTERGYTVIHTTNEKDFWKIIVNSPPQLILMDLSLPEINSREILKVIKNEKKLSVPIIIVSANQNARKISEEIGADDVLEKPFTLENLEKKVAQYL